MSRTRRIALGTVLSLCTMGLTAAAAPPQITRIAQPTLQSGAATLLVIEGTDLLPNPAIVLPVPIEAQTVKDGATDKRVQIEVKLAGSVPTGIYPLRMASDKGISSPVSVDIDDTPATPFPAQIASLPASLVGTLSGSATLTTTLVGKKGQRLVLEVAARRFGSNIDPVIKLFDSRRVQLAWAQGNVSLAGDTRLVTELPADGTYTIELHDGQYKAAAPGYFRLRVGDLQYADLTFPLAGQRGTKPSFQLLGSLPDTSRVEADLTTALAGTSVRLPRLPGMAGAAPRILVSEIPEIIAGEPPVDKPQEMPIPGAINGRLRKAKEEHRYRFTVAPGMKLRFDVLAERAGSPLDGVLVLYNEAGAQLVRSDDQPGTLDPGLDYTVPAGLNALVAAVSDLHGRGGPNFVYRLAVTPLGQPDFSLALLEDRAQVPRSGSTVVRVRAARAGYNGPIKLALSGLPEGVTLTGDDIPADAGETLVSLTAPEGTKLTQTVLKVIGTSTDPNIPLTRLATVPETPLARALPELRNELAVALTEPAIIGVAWDLADAGLPIGGSIPAKVTVTRTAEAKTPIRLVLLTSQVVPKTKGTNVDDVTRAVRLEGTPALAADQAMADIKILVPADLPPLLYDVALRAELLAADGKTVLATAVTPARRSLAAK